MFSQALSEKNSSLRDSVWTHNNNPTPFSTKFDLQYDSIEKNLSKYLPFDAVLLLAAIADPTHVYLNSKEAMEVNLEYTKKLLLEVNQLGTKLIFFSSVEVFNGKNAPHYEETTKSPLNLYGRLKSEVEDYIEQLFPSKASCIVRTPWIVNDSYASRCIVKNTHQGLMSGKMSFAIDYLSSAVSAFDVYKGVDILLKSVNSLPKLIHFASKNSFSRYDLAQFVFEHSRFNNQMSLRSTTFDSLDLSEARSKDTRLHSNISWNAPFIEPQNIWDVVSRKVSIIDSRLSI